MLRMDWPQVKRFARAASMHRAAARIVLDECPPKAYSILATEVIYLSGYVLECSLKALVLSNTPLKQHEKMIERFKADIKHDLEKLRLLLHEKGIEITKKNLTHFRQVFRIWNSEMRYEAKPREKLVAESIVAATESLADWIAGD